MQAPGCPKQCNYALIYQVSYIIFMCYNLLFLKIIGLIVKNCLHDRQFLCFIALCKNQFANRFLLNIKLL